LKPNGGLNHTFAITNTDTDRNMASPPNIPVTTYSVKVCTWGCCDTVSDIINVWEGAKGSVCCDTCVSSGTPVTLTAADSNKQTIVASWEGGKNGNLNSTKGNSVIASPQVTTTYTVTFQNTQTNCKFIDTVTVCILNCNIFVPNIFSPNGDGINDILYVHSECIKRMDFAVFDRWGNKVFETTNINDGWNGTYHGKPMEMGTYVWYLNATLYSGKVMNEHGNVAIIR
jgi:gliding motility-associated-like protein